MNERIKTILEHLHIPDARYVGAGMTAAVYAFDEEHVVKIHDGDNCDYVHTLQRFYQQVATYPLPYVVPQIKTVSQHAGICYDIQKHLTGVELAQCFPHLSSSEKEKVLDNFIQALPPLHAITFPQHSYGEVIGYGETVQAPSWAGFLHKKLTERLQTTQDSLREDLPAIDQWITHYFQQLLALPDPPQKSLVHGDYFYANVLVNDQQQITALLDFSPLTLIGDHLLDVAGALYFSEVFDFTTPAEIDYLQQAIIKQYGEACLPRLEFYIVYYGLLFSNCKEFDPSTYQWGLQHLRRYGKNL